MDKSNLNFYTAEFATLIAISQEMNLVIQLIHAFPVMNFLEKLLKLGKVLQKWMLEIIVQLDAW